MKMWLKILLVVWFGVSIWYYLCQINAHCSTGFPAQQVKETTVSPKEKLTKVEPQQKPQEESKKQDSILKSQTKEQAIEERLKNIENNLTSTSVFSFNSNETGVIINADADKLVADLSFYLKHKPNSKIKLIGHTDYTGTRKLNYRLGKWRAKNAIDLLIQRGIPKSKLLLDSKGETMPIGDNKTKEGRKKNRRVEIQFIH